MKKKELKARIKELTYYFDDCLEDQAEEIHEITDRYCDLQAADKAKAEQIARLKDTLDKLRKVADAEHTEWVEKLEACEHIYTVFNTATVKVLTEKLSRIEELESTVSTLNKQLKTATTENADLLRELEESRNKGRIAMSCLSEVKVLLGCEDSQVADVSDILKGKLEK